MEMSKLRSNTLKPFFGVQGLYGVLVVKGEQRTADHTLRRFQIRPLAVEHSHSIVYRFSEPFDAIRCLEALKWAKIKARIIFHI